MQKEKMEIKKLHHFLKLTLLKYLATQCWCQTNQVMQLYIFSFSAIHILYLFSILKFKGFPT